MAAPKETRIQIVAPISFQEDVDAWRMKTGGLSRSEAIRSLVRLGLKCNCGSAVTPDTPVLGPGLAKRVKTEQARKAIHITGVQLGPTKTPAGARLKATAKPSKWKL